MTRILFVPLESMIQACERTSSQMHQVTKILQFRLPLKGFLVILENQKKSPLLLCLPGH